MTSLTSTEFRRDPELVKEAKRILSDPTLALMIDIAMRESPSRVEAKVTADLLGVQLGRIYGYESAFDALRSFGVGIAPPITDDDLKADSSPED